MKYFILTLLPTFYFLSFAGVYSNAPQHLITKSHELTDIKDIPFAWNLRDWLGKKVDSLSMDVYYPTGATSNKNYPTVMLIHAGDFTGGN